MSLKTAIAKVLLWAIIKMKGVERLLGGAGHSHHICGLEPWKGPDGGPWMGVCSLRICPYYEACLKKWGR